MLTLECVMLSLECGMLSLECGMLTLEYGMLTLGCGMLTLECEGVLVLYVVKSHADASIGKSAQFHAERTDREPLGRPVARYSAVVVFAYRVCVTMDCCLKS